MNKLDVGRTLEIFANLAVLVGIIFLVIEISQNTEMMRAQMAQGRAETAMDQAESLYNSEYLPEIFVAIERGQRLTDDQRVRFTAYLRAFNRNQDNILRQYREGLLGEEVAHSLRDAVRAELAQKAIAREIWENTKAGYTEEYVALVDDVVAEYLGDGTAR